MTRKNLIATLLFIVAFVACSKNADMQVEKPFHKNNDTIRVNSNSSLIEKLVLSPVEEEYFSREIVVAGIIQGIPTQLAYIAPPFSGRVSKSYISLGQSVKVNAPLFEIASSDFTNAQKEYFQARSELELARNDMKRKNDLLRNGVASQREMEEASNALSIAEKEYENASAAIKIFQTDPEKMILGQPLIIRSPINGDVIENKLVTGLYISAESDPVATVANLSKVWVAAQVKEKDIRFINNDDEMHIHVMALPDKMIEGKIFHIDQTVNEDTRSIQIISECDNVDHLLKMGMYVTVHFMGANSNHITIADKSLLQDNDNSYVYVQVAPNTFVKRAVEAEIMKGGKAIITKGLSKGEMIISEGGYYLK